MIVNCIPFGLKTSFTPSTGAKHSLLFFTNTEIKTIEVLLLPPLNGYKSEFELKDFLHEVY